MIVAYCREFLLDTAIMSAYQDDIHTSGARSLAGLLLEIASALQPGKLAPKITCILLEVSGAERAVLLLKKHNRFVIEAEAPMRDESAAAMRSIIPDATDFPLTALDAVEKTREVVVLTRAAADQRFSADPYLRAHQPAALLCLPLIYAEQLIGIAYLEHHANADVFRPERIETLRILSAQASIAIDHAYRAAELHQRHNPYHTLFEDSRDTMFITSSKETIADISPSCVEMLGYAREELVGQDTGILYADPSSRQNLPELLIQHGAVRDYEVQFRHKDGSTRVCLLTATLRPEQPDALYQGIVRDITERKSAEAELENYRLHLEELVSERTAELLRANDILEAEIAERKQIEQALRESEARYRMLAENMLDVIWYFDIDKGFTYVSPSIVNLRGYTPEEMYQQELSEVLTPDSLRLVQQKFQEGTYGVERLELEQPCKDGSTVWTECTVTPMYDEAGQLCGWIGVSRDISDRRKNDASLRQLARAVEQSPSAVVITNINGTIEYVNPAFTQVTGYTFDEARGQNPRILKTGDKSAEFYANLWRTITSGKVWRGEFHNRRKNGALFWELASISPITDAEGNITHFVGIKEDITERKHMEETLRRNIQQLDALRATMNAIFAELDLDLLLRMILQRATELTATDSGFIALYDEERGDLHIVESLGSAYVYRGKRRQLGKGALGITAQTRQPMTILNYPEWEGRFLDADVSYMPYSILTIPLLLGNRLLGVIGITKDIPGHTIDIEQGQLLRFFAEQATISIRTAQILNNAQRRAKEAETLREASAAVVATLNHDQAIQRILEQLAIVVPYDSASVQLLDGNESEIVGSHGFADPSAVIGIRFPVTERNPSAIVYRERRPYILPDAHVAYEEFRQPPHSHIRSWLGAPLIVHNEIIGMLALNSTELNHFTARHASLVAAFADQVAIALENARLFTEVQQLATIDPLTGLYNRRYFFTLAEAEIQRSQRYRHMISVIVLDVDDFKGINDTYGHLIGDKVLCSVAEQCRLVLRAVDIIGRYGGEEMIVLAPETDLAGAYHLAERLRQKLEQHAVVIDEERISVTASIGLATYTGQGNLSLDRLIDYADRAMYAAKHKGKNRVVQWVEDGTQNEN